MSSNLLVIYLHGFNSSPDSYKAGLLKKALAKENIEYLIPGLPPIPVEAVNIIEILIDRYGSRQIVLIGSSLGGYYAFYFAEKFNLHAVLINPAIRPYELLCDYLGLNENMYTHEKFELTREHLMQLRSIDVVRPSNPENYLLLVQTSDELLDYQQAVKKFNQSRKFIIQGGSHGFDEFENVIDDILSFIYKY